MFHSLHTRITPQSNFFVEVQDNWRNALSYNLPIDELMAVMDNAVNNGYTFAWGADVSEEAVLHATVLQYALTQKKEQNLQAQIWLAGWA